MVVLSELSEGSSSSSSADGLRYDVFISFRGLDTRKSFTAFLYKALVDANITTFLDDEEIETGEDLKPELESAIKASRASIIVLSKNYATSTWCLDELVLILEQHMASNQIVIPVFYHVEPTHVRKQQSSFADAMTKHRQMMEAETNASKRSKWAQKMDRWNKALIQVADLKGKDVNGRKETEFIEEIVKDIYRRLRISSRVPPPQLFGMYNSIEFVTLWLKDTSSHTIDILTISGMGGIGKTSLAKYVYALHSHEFDRSCFIQDISPRCKIFNGLLDLQKQFYDNISKPSPIQIYDASIYSSMIEDAVSRKKVFVVLDDIDSLDQLDALLGRKGFHPGSKIIITTKDTSLIQSCEVFKMNVKPKHANHTLLGLDEIQSLELLCSHAFMCNYPRQGYVMVSKKLVKYCEGHPMALKVLGRSLHNRDVAYWEGYIDKLKKENDSPINNVLRVSFESLPSKNDKDLFKHIACFFVGMDKDVAETILEACDIETRTGITNLIDRCLLSIGYNNDLMLHQLVQEMGRFVVREESSDKPWERSRLWGHDSFKVLKQKKGTENVVGLTLDMRLLETESLRGSCEVKTDALSKMNSLMLLQLNYVQINGSYEKFPEELRWLCMHGFPLKSIPSDLSVENVVALDMSYSKIESFGICYSNPQRLQKRQKQLDGSCLKDKMLLGSLKILNLSFSQHLHSVGGFDQFPELERLIVTSCNGLLEVCESIEQCVELVHIDLSYCNKLEKLPRNLGMLKKVKTLLLDGCNLGESQIKIRDMDSLEKLKATNIDINSEASSSAIVEAIPMDSKLFAISLPRCLVSLSLVDNNLFTESFPMDLSSLSMLKDLYLDSNPIVSMPTCVRSLPRLQTLSMLRCDMLMSIEHPPPTLRDFWFFNEKSLLRKVVFDPEMSPIRLSIGHEILSNSSFEFEGMINVQPIGGVEEKVLRSLGWSELDFLKERRVEASYVTGKAEESEIQMYYEFGIFSTIYGDEEMPNWITERSNVPSISFTIPSSPKQLTGLNFCYVLMTYNEGFKNFQGLPMIVIRNITKNHTWIYKHYIISFYVGGDCLIFLSHWMFGMNEMEAGDHVTITMAAMYTDEPILKECGFSFVYDDGNTDDEEDVLGYYKSWNHIIGRDLSGFQTTTGEYLLSNWRFLFDQGILLHDVYWSLFGENSRYKDEELQFRALSQTKSGIRIAENGH